MKPGWLHLGGAISAVAFLTLAWFSHREVEVNVWWFLALTGIAWAAVLSTFAFTRVKYPEQQLGRVILTWAVALRFIGFFGEPILEDDYFRYLWDGRQFALTGNPYSTAPAQSFADEALPDRFQTILSNINYPEVPTIYGPVCQYVFLAGYIMAPGQLWPIKLFFVVADLMTLLLLRRMTSIRGALLYAWCPLLIKEVAFTAHPEILGIVFIVGAMRVMQHGRNGWAALLCACAVAARIQAILLVPFLFWLAVRARRDFEDRPAADVFGWLRMIDVRSAARFVGLFTGTLAVLYAPFWLQGSSADLAGLRTFLGEWEFNSSLFGLVKELTSFQTAKVLCTLLFGIFLVVWFARTVRRHHVGRNVTMLRGDVVFGAFLLCSAVVNPWYLLWLLPFVAMQPSLTGITALVVVSLSYLTGGNLGWANLGPFDHPKWLRPLEYGIVLAAALVEWRRNLVAAKRKAG